MDRGEYRQATRAVAPELMAVGVEPVPALPAKALPEILSVVQPVQSHTDRQLG